MISKGLSQSKILKLHKVWIKISWNSFIIKCLVTENLGCNSTGAISHLLPNSQLPSAACCGKEYQLHVPPYTIRNMIWNSQAGLLFQKDFLEKPFSNRARLIPYR